MASRALPGGILLPTAVLVAISCLFSVVAGPLFRYTDAAAAQLADRPGYVTDVLGMGGR